MGPPPRGGAGEGNVMMAPSLSVLMARGQSREEEVSLQAVMTDPPPPALMEVSLSDLRDLPAEAEAVPVLRGCVVTARPPQALADPHAPQADLSARMRWLQDAKNYCKRFKQQHNQHNP